MTLDEAIKHCEEVAEKNEKQASWFWGKEGNPDYEKCVECASEHRQLAEWLRELKAYREAREEITRKRNSGQWSEAVVFGFSRAIHIIDKHLMEVNADEE